MNQNNVKIEETLMMRLNRAMAAIEIVPGGMVEVRKENSNTIGGPRGFLHGFVKIESDDLGDYLSTTNIKEGAILLYLGIENLGPVGPYSQAGGSSGRAAKQIILGKQNFLAYKFLQEDYFVYLLILEPHDYYNVFIKKLKRIGGIMNLGK